MLSDAPLILDEIHGSLEMVALWNNYQHKFDYARGIAWDDVMSSVRNLYCAIHNSNPHANINNES